MCRWVVLLLVIVSVWSSTVDSQTVACRTVGNSGRIRGHIGYIELTFSTPYTNGSYTFYQTLASLKVKHTGVNNRPFPVVGIHYASSTNIYLYLVDAADLEGNTGYQFNVSYVPLVNRTSHWLSFSGTPAQPFSCLTIDNSPPVAMFSLWYSNTVDGIYAAPSYYAIYFSELVTGNFTETGLFLTDLGVSPSSCTVTPYLPNAGGYSNHYKTSTISMAVPNFQGFMQLLTGVVTDQNGNTNIQSRACLTIDPVSNNYYFGRFLETTSLSMSNTVINCYEYLSTYMPPSHTIYDLNDDGAIDTVYIFQSTLFDQNSVNASLVLVNAATTIQGGVLGVATSIPTPVSVIPDDSNTDNVLAFNVSMSVDLFRTNESIVLYLPPTTIALSYLFSTIRTVVDIERLSSNIRSSQFVSPVIQTAIARNRSYVCVTVSRKNISNLGVSTFYLASYTNNFFSASAESTQYSTCLVLSKPLTSSVVHHRSSDHDILFLESIPYGNAASETATQWLGVPLASRIPTWKGSTISMFEYTPSLLVSSNLIANNNETTWQTLRLVFNEAVNVDNGTFNVSIVPFGSLATSLIYSITVSPLSAVQVNSYTIDFPLSVTCYNSSYCFGTDTPSFRIERIEGFEDTFFNLLVPLLNGVVTPSDTVRPHHMSSQFVNSYIVKLVFSEAVEFVLAADSSILFSSSAGRSFAIDPDVNGNKITLTFDSPTSYDVITFHPCGILIRDLNGNSLVCDPLTPTILVFGSSSSSSSSSTGGFVSSSSSSSGVLLNVANSTFSFPPVDADVMGIEFPVFLFIVFSAITIGLGGFYFAFLSSLL